MAWSPGEYGTATSISVFSKYFLVLLKRRPPRDRSSHATTSSGKPGRRTQAFKLMRVRACLRRFSCSFTEMRVPGGGELDDSAVGTSDGSLAGAMPALRFPAARVIGSSGASGGSGCVHAAFVHAAPANVGDRSAAPLGRWPSRHEAGATGGSARDDKSGASSPDGPSPDGPACSPGTFLGGGVSVAAKAGAPGRPTLAGRLSATGCLHSVDDPHFWQ